MILNEQYRSYKIKNKMKKSMCCNEDVIYLGFGRDRIITFALGGVYWYCCSQCGKIEWSSEKEKSKYKWYKYDKKIVKNR